MNTQVILEESTSSNTVFLSYFLPLLETQYDLQSAKQLRIQLLRLAKNFVLVSCYNIQL